MALRRKKCDTPVYFTYVALRFFLIDNNLNYIYNCSIIAAIRHLKEKHIFNLPIDLFFNENISISKVTGL